MQRLIELILTFRDQITLVLLVIISNLLIFSNQIPQMNQLRALAFSLFASAEETVGGITRLTDAIRENDLLRQENLRLSEEVYRLRSARLENIRLRRELGFSPANDPDLIPADVIRKELFQRENYFTVNKGTSAGIREQSLVRTSEGSVGRVVLATDDYALIQLMTSKSFRMGARIQRTNTEGIVTWNGEHPGHVYLSNIVQTADVRKGDPVVTSRFSSFAPEGIPVGIVDSIHVDPRQLFKTIRVRTMVDLTKTDHVYIIRAESADSTLLPELTTETAP
ncbi:MAG: rod shape-determining protein MreC [Bacteroidetes bacterium]|nr:rod shape-determining protein MreC [Bacteroidota bacterium]